MRDRTRLPFESGQSATEYMLMISVLVVAIVAGAYAFVPSFRSGTLALASDVGSILDDGSIGGVGLNRGGAQGANAVSSFTDMPLTGASGISNSDNPMANNFGNGAPIDAKGRTGTGLGQPGLGQSMGTESMNAPSRDVPIGRPANAAVPLSNKNPTF